MTLSAPSDASGQAPAPLRAGHWPTLIVDPDPDQLGLALAGDADGAWLMVCTEDPTRLGRLAAVADATPAGHRCLFLHGSAADLLRVLPLPYARVLAGPSVTDAALAGLRRHCAAIPKDAVPDDGTLADLRDALRARIAAAGPVGDRTPAADLTAALRRRIAGAQRRGAAGPAPWPHAPSPGPTLPPTLPDGRPWPRVSVVVPTLNQGRFIEETLLSVLNQGYPAVELIVVDGGSTDETLAVIERYRDRLAWFDSRKDKGQADAINRGMGVASGDILTWLNSDDMLAPGALATVALEMATTGADLVAGVCEIRRDGRPVRRHLTLCPDGPLPLEKLLDLDGSWNAGTFFYQPEVMFSRRIWDAAGGRVDPDLNYSMDWDLWVRFAAAGAKLRVIGATIALFRLHPGQKTHEPTGYRGELARARDAWLARTGLPAPAPAAPRLREDLRIVMLNDVGFVDGAGIAHGRIAAALADAGHHVLPVALAEKPVDPHGDWPAPTNMVLAAVGDLRPDLVIVGNLHAARPDPSLIAALAERWPTLFVLHDFWLLTGRCPYPQLCGGDAYITGCDASCPDPEENPRLEPERIGPAWDGKRRVLTAEAAPVLLVNSDWSAAVAEAAAADMAQRCGRRPAVERVTLPLPLDLFAPADRTTARRLLGLPTDAFLIFLTVTDFGERRKGAPDLLEALERLDLPDIALVTAGRGTPPASIAGIPVHHLGYIKDPTRLALAYAAADMLVSPSRVETFGQVFAEAAACGTPALGYAVSGVREAVADGVSGLLVPPGADEIAAGIALMHRDPDLRAGLAAWGRIRAGTVWTPAACARSIHLALERTGIAARLELAPHLTLMAKRGRVAETVHVLPAATPWLPRDNFGDPEGPFPELGLPRFRWARGPVAALDVTAAEDGACLLALFVHSPLPDQSVELVQHGAVVGRFALPHGDLPRRIVLRCPVTLCRGANRFLLRFTRWLPDRNADALALVGVRAIPSRRPDEGGAARPEDAATPSCDGAVPKGPIDAGGTPG